MFFGEIVTGTRKAGLFHQAAEGLAALALVPMLAGREAAIGKMIQTTLTQMGEGQLGYLAVVSQERRKGRLGQRAAQIDDRQPRRVQDFHLLTGRDTGQNAVATPVPQPARRGRFQAPRFPIDGPALMFVVITGHPLEHPPAGRPR